MIRSNLNSAQSNRKLLDELMTPPAESYTREHTSSFLYAPFSKKCHRRIQCYGHATYNVWVLLETDPNIISFNERPPIIPVVGKDNRVVNFSAAFVAKYTDQSIVVHAIKLQNCEPEFEDTCHTLVGAALWATQNELNIRVWRVEELNEKTVELENLKRLLRYVSMPAYVRHKGTIANIRTVLERGRKETVCGLSRCQWTQG